MNSDVYVNDLETINVLYVSYGYSSTRWSERRPYTQLEIGFFDEAHSHT